mmetsp:Transcript_4605/g.19605  ORF Transcript_4605/g.19605 Transcript_4605/m.19605 type:complete len:608 (+) Transcript_4605:245-2068(+)
MQRNRRPPPKPPHPCQAPAKPSQEQSECIHAPGASRVGLAVAGGRAVGPPRLARKGQAGRLLALRAVARLGWAHQVRGQVTRGTDGHALAGFQRHSPSGGARAPARGWPAGRGQPSSKAGRTTRWQSNSRASQGATAGHADCSVRATASDPPRAASLPLPPYAGGHKPPRSRADGPTRGSGLVGLARKQNNCIRFMCRNLQASAPLQCQAKATQAGAWALYRDTSFASCSGSTGFVSTAFAPSEVSTSLSVCRALPETTTTGIARSATAISLYPRLARSRAICWRFFSTPNPLSTGISTSRVTMAGSFGAALARAPSPSLTGAAPAGDLREDMDVPSAALRPEGATTSPAATPTDAALRSIRLGGPVEAEASGGGDSAATCASTMSRKASTTAPPCSNSVASKPQRLSSAASSVRFTRSSSTTNASLPRVLAARRWDRRRLARRRCDCSPSAAASAPWEAAPPACPASASRAISLTARRRSSLSCCRSARRAALDALSLEVAAEDRDVDRRGAIRDAASDAVRSPARPEGDPEAARCRLRPWLRPRLRRVAVCGEGLPPVVITVNGGSRSDAWPARDRPRSRPTSSGAPPPPDTKPCSESAQPRLAA